jgi:hypothetical protein
MEFAAVGETATYWDADGSIYLADLASGRVDKIGRTIDGAPPSEWIDDSLQAFEFDGRGVYWLESARDSIPDRVPCLANGPISWQLYRLDVSTRNTTTIRSGVQTQDVYCGPIQPVFDVDGDTVALAHDSAGGGWDIDLTSIASGALVRTIHADAPVQSVSVSDDGVAYVVGTVQEVVSENQGGGYRSTPTFVGTRLMLSETSGDSPRLLAEDAYSVQLDQDRLIWMKGFNQNVSPVPGSLMTSLVTSWSPVDLSDIRFAEYSQNGSLVTWWGDGENLWRASDQAAAHIDLPWDPEVFSGGTVSDGWFTWYGTRYAEMGGPEFIFGIPIADIPL